MKKFSSFSSIAILLILGLQAQAQVVLTGTTGTVGPFTVQAGGCLTTSTTITGATTTGMTVTVAPVAGVSPGPAIYQYGWVSSTNIVTIAICNPIAGPIGAAAYAVNVLTGAGGGGGTVTAVTATAPLTSSGGATPNISATYQGNGAKVQASTGTTTTNDCVKFDASGNTIDAGAACSSGGVTSVSATAPLTSSGGATPNISATYQGNGAKVQASTGTTTTNDCVKFDASGNTIDAGAACSSGGVTSVSATAPLTSSGGATPIISATYQGNGAKVQASTGSTTTNDCVKFDGNGNTVDGGAACGTVTSVTATAPLTSSGGATPIISATYQGNGAKVQASTGTTTTNDCVKFDGNGNTVDAGAACSAITATGAEITTSTGQTIPNNADTTPAMATTVTDNGGFSGGSCGSAANTCLTVPSGKAGWYVITAAGRYSGSLATGSSCVWLKKNGSFTTGPIGMCIANASVDSTAPLQSSYVTLLAVGDYIQVDLYQNSGSSQTTSNVTLSMAFVN